MTRALLVLFLVACGGRPAAPPQPAFDVRTEIEQAEKAEKARQHDVAKLHYERAVAGARDPASGAYARREYAETLVTWGEYPLAIEHLRVVVQLAPGDPRAWHDLGILLHNRGDNPGAIQALERARDLSPKSPAPRIALAALRWKLGEKQAAADEYRKLLDLDLPERLRAKVEWALQQLAKG
jgi:Flp pilus assembly protein TadD